MAARYSQPDTHILLVSILSRLGMQYDTSAISAAREAEIMLDNLVTPINENEYSFRIGIAAVYFRLSQVITKQVVFFSRLFCDDKG